MVTVTRPASAAAAAAADDVEGWLRSLAEARGGIDVDFIRRACRFAERAHAGQSRASGEPYVEHAFAVARILGDLTPDHEAIAAAILHDTVEDTPATLDDIRREFGERVARLVDGVTKMEVIQEYKGVAVQGRREQAQAESLRKMLLAMAEDVDVVLIKLADRLHNMRTLAPLPEEKQKRIARETMDIFAPLANRLGIWQLKWELEDLAFRYLEPVAYRQIATLLAEKRVDRERYIEEFCRRLKAELQQAGIKAEVTGRPKHIYGIWRKMRRKGKDFGQITDVRGVRILVETVRDCYAALGVVHGLWQYVPGEFDDYIATPKENYYRSIHTAVLGPEGKIVEVQIRTYEMHQQSELGVAAHWRYKEGIAADIDFDRKIAWLRSLLEWKDEVAEASDFVDQFKSEVFSERVYVFTPKGKIIDLPAGSTPLDFAYHVHTDIGHRCRGAKVDGRIVPLTYKLKTGEQVEVLTVKEGGPSRDWLNPHLGYLHSSRARSKVQHWFRQQNYELSVADGRTVLERELHRLGLVDVNYERLTQKFGFAKVDEFLAAVGRGDVKSSQIVNAVQELVELPREARPLPSVPTTAPARSTAPGVTILGVGNLLTRIGRCCNPVPGDPIVGFITRGQGITVHRRDCPNALRHHGENEERLIEVSWGAAAGGTYPVEIEVIAYERPGLLRDITALLANERINVVALNTVVDKGQHIARMTFTVEIPDLHVLARLLALIDRVPNVAEVRRKVQ
ncbi:MAG TPA: GTP diphosphokinase [Gammaproteobacteria bacterium]